MSEVIDRARSLFVEEGVEGAGIEALRAVTGKSVGSLYHRFGSKEGIAGAVYAEALGAYQEAMLAELRRHREAEPGVKAAVRHHLSWHQAEPDRARFLHENAGLARRDPGRSLVRELNAAFFDEASAWVQAHVARGAIRHLPFDLAYVLWLGGAQEYCRLWLAGATRVGMRAAKRALAEGAWKSLRAEGTT